MVYPAQSNFTTAGAGDAWWSLDVDGATFVCQTSGLEFIRLVQRVLRDAPSQRSFDGNTVAGSAVNVDGRWGPLTSRVLWNLLKRMGAPDDLLTQVAHEAGYRTAGGARLGRGSLVAAVWLLRRLGPQPVSVDQIHLPADVVPPVWLVSPPIAADLGAGIQCFVPDRSPAPAPLPPPSPAAPPATEAPPVPTQPLPVEDVAPGVPLPTGLERPAVTGSSISWGLLATAVVGVGGLVFLGSWIRKGARS